MVRRTLPRRPVEWLLAAACVAVYCVILYAGLSPFTFFPPNQVTWSPDGRGLRFGDYGTLLSSGPFELRGSADGSCALALWLEPGETIDSNVMIDFYAPENPLRFRLRQARDDLLLLRDVEESGGRFRTRAIDIAHTFRKGDSVLIGVSAGPNATSLYLNGKLARSVSGFGLSSSDFRGLIIIGNSPLDQDSWSGLLKGLAIYNRALTGLEMLQLYQSWKPGDSDGSIKQTQPAAIFSFNEGSGTVVRDQMRSGVDLTIPKSFLTVDQRLLTPFWKEYYSDPGYWKNVAINVGGFVPLGFCFCAFLLIRGMWKRPVLATILFGFATSLMIEVLQAYIPMRNSGTTDVITNTLGTVLGALSCNSAAVRALVARTGFRLE